MQHKELYESARRPTSPHYTHVHSNKEQKITECKAHSIVSAANSYRTSKQHACHSKLGTIVHVKSVRSAGKHFLTLLPFKCSLPADVHKCDEFRENEPCLRVHDFLSNLMTNLVVCNVFNVFDNFDVKLCEILCVCSLFPALGWHHGAQVALHASLSARSSRKLLHTGTYVQELNTRLHHMLYYMLRYEIIWNFVCLCVCSFFPALGQHHGTIYMQMYNSLVELSRKMLTLSVANRTRSSDI